MENSHNPAAYGHFLFLIKEGLRKERDRLHLSYAVPETGRASEHLMHLWPHGIAEPLPFTQNFTKNYQKSPTLPTLICTYKMLIKLTNFLSSTHLSMLDVPSDQ